MDAHIRDVEEDIKGKMRAQQECQQDMERCKADKADNSGLTFYRGQHAKLVKVLQQLREELEQLREEKLLLLRKI